MYKQNFGFNHAPFGKLCKTLWNGDQLIELERQFNWLLKSPGVGMLTAEPGLGKTAALRKLTGNLNPHEYRVRYTCETDFGRLDFYRQLAQSFGLVPAFRRIDLWRNIKGYITNLVQDKHVLPILIIDEAQNLSPEFLRDFPSFINFVFDSRDYITIWFIGHTEFARIIDRPCNAALASRIQARCSLRPIDDKEEFNKILKLGISEAGCTSTLFGDTAVDLIRMATKGNFRQVHRLLVTSLNLATDQKLNHLPDDIIKKAIEILKQA